MDLVMGSVQPKTHQQLLPVHPSINKLLNQVDQCLELMTRTGATGLTNAAPTLSLALTQLFDTTIIITSYRHTFTIIFDDPRHKFNLTGCLIENTFSNILHPEHPTYIVSLNRQLIRTSDDLVEAIYDYI